MTAASIVALTIFVAMFVFIVIDKFERQVVTLVCGFTTLLVVLGVMMHSMDAVLRVLNFKSILTLGFWYHASETGQATGGINWSTIIFILGMMIMVEGMAKVGFFQWLCMTLAKAVHYKPMPLFVVFMLMSAFLSMFIDSITVILFLAAVTVELGKLLDFDPVPMILSEIFCANLGGSATMSGDPPNIIIGTSLGYSFGDFLANTGVIAMVGLVCTIVYFVLIFRKELTAQSQTPIDVDKLPKPEEAITNKKDFYKNVLVFALAIVLLITHAKTGLTVATIGVVVGALTLLFAGDAVGELLRKIDYKTLLFFVGLFMVVGGLEETGVLEIIATFIGEVSHGDVKMMVVIIIWISAIASAFVDNIPFAATMVPIIQNLAATQGVSLPMLAWTLSLGVDIGGSTTPIGASANVVGTSVAAKNGHVIGWGKYCKVCAPITVIVVGLSMLMIFARYC